ncbi:MAG: MFS transporter [Rubellimicrobium sp.]|nr:MFS transporter [Rubellimicrobium sp.]
MMTTRRRIWGWMFFDWAQQPFYTLGLTFVFGPYFASVAAAYFAGQGLDPGLADARAQSLWTAGQTVSGLAIALLAPFIGAWADASGRKMPWIAGFAAAYVLCSAGLWFLMPDGRGLWLALVLFGLGTFAAEGGINVSNAILPSLGDERAVGRISGSGAAFGYWGGVVSLVLMLAFLAENAGGVTLLGRAPAFGLDPVLREGTRAVGPFIALWCVVFMVPFFLWVREPATTARRVRIGAVARELGRTLRGLRHQLSLASYLVSSMLYRDALNGIYAIGGVYAALVLGWSIIEIGVFGVIGALTAAVVTWAGGLYDARVGPKPVITVSVWALVVVSVLVVAMSREQIFGVPLPPGSRLPDVLFYICGAVIGGAGGSVQAASRTLMVLHSDPARPAEGFGLFALSGKATAFLAPALVTLATAATGSVRLGVAPVIVLFLVALFLLRFVSPTGETQA